jgi:predicted nucleic acid-binding protein
MKSVVIDANVIVKWIFPEKSDEDYQSQALFLLHNIKKGDITVYQPPHWLVEVAAVVARIEPAIATEAISLLHELNFSVISEQEIYQLACQLSNQFNHHLFDTLYHATALYLDYSFITADDKYFRKAAKLGGILRLADFLLN